MTVGDMVLALRENLREYPVRKDCASFVNRELYALGMSFFPGDLGLYDPNRTSISTIVLGTDWGNEDSLERYLNTTTHKSNATVRNTDRMLLEAGFDLRDCLYTNAWPVLRKGAAPEQGHHPMRDDRAFTQAYRDFFRRTLESLRPKIVITLGFAAAWFLGPFLGEDWALGRIPSPRLIQTIHLDVEPLRMHCGIVFVNATHPSHLHNRELRRFHQDENETALLVRARRLAGIPDASESTLNALRPTRPLDTLPLRPS
jgi:uracil-DNA glycosylase